jgi:PAS domain S-box-containing protein
MLECNYQSDVPPIAMRSELPTQASSSGDAPANLHSEGPTAAAEAGSFAATPAGESLSGLFEHFPDAIAVYRGDEFLFVNAKLAKLLGYGAPEEVRCLGRQQLVERHALANDGASLMPGPAAVERQSKRTELRVRHRDGSARLVERTLARVLCGGDVVVAWICRDITESKSAATKLARAERLVSLGKLASGVAHEINDPLAYMAVNVDLAIDELRAMQRGAQRAGTGEPVPSAGRVAAIVQALNDVRDGVRRVGQIVDDLKTLAVTEQGAVATVDARIALDAAVAAVRPNLPCGVRLEKDYADVADVRGTETWLSRALSQVLLNAAHALADSAGERALRLVVRPAKSAHVVVVIEDTGGGIAPESLARVFDPFYTTKLLERARGLGLTVAHAIVTSLGGTIAVESELGRGTRVTIRLPTVPQSGVNG